MTTHPKPARVDLGDGDSLILFRTSDHHTTVRFHSANANTQLAGAVMETGALRAALDEVAPLGKYTRTTPDPDDMDGGVAAALIEKEVEQPDAEVRELRSALARELARGNALQDALDAAKSRPLTADAIESVLHDILPLTTEHLEADDIANIASDLYLALTGPTRPEGAEEIEALLAGSWPIDREGLSAAADDLAMNGVRVVSEDGEDR